MYSSSLKRPPRERVLVIREWQLKICDGNACAAALLSVFEYWHDVKLNSRRNAIGHNDVAEKHGDERTQDESLFQWHTTEDLIKATMGLFGKNKIIESRKQLKDLGIISEHSNPNPKYTFDKTIYFLFHTDVLHELIKKSSSAHNSNTLAESSDSPKQDNRASENKHSSSDLGHSSSENKRSSSDLGQPIAKTTPKTTTKTTPKTKNHTVLSGGKTHKDSLKLPTSKELEKSQDSSRNLIYPRVFEEFWNIYPRNEHKKQAYDKFVECAKIATSETLVVAAKNYAVSVAKRDYNKIMMPKTFLNPNNRLWETYIHGPTAEAHQGEGVGPAMASNRFAAASAAIVNSNNQGSINPSQIISECDFEEVVDIGIE